MFWCACIFGYIGVCVLVCLMCGLCWCVCVHMYMCVFGYVSVCVDVCVSICVCVYGNNELLHVKPWAWNIVSSP